MTMKDDKDIINDALMARIRELEASQKKQQKIIERLSIKDYLLGQFVFTNRGSLLNDFAVFAEENYKECAHHHGYNDIEQQVIDILKDLADGIDAKNKNNFKELFGVLGGLEVNKNT